MSEQSTQALSGGISIPRVGLGVFKVEPDGAQRVVEDALAVGYRHVDTAAAYVNEAGVGAGLRASGLARDDVFVTSKLRNGDQGFDSALRAYDDTCERLGLDALDLYLIHWPNPAAGLWQDSWRALERLLDEGRVRSIGVSNFLPEHLEELTSFATHLPAVNQVEVHPAFQQADVVAASESRGVVVEAYSPLGQGAALTQGVVADVAAQVGATPAQVVLAWHLRHGRVVIPKTTSRDRMVENLAASAVVLDDAQAAALDGLETGGRVGGDPRTFSLSQIR
jgi:2,5-diketo-D-gluconate reductase A